MNQTKTIMSNVKQKIEIPKDKFKVANMQQQNRCSNNDKKKPRNIATTILKKQNNSQRKNPQN